MAIKYGDKQIKTVDELDVQNKNVFVRVDFNVPLADGKVEDDTRIRAALPTLQFLLKAGAHLTLASHLGRPKKGPEPKYSMLPVGERLAELIDHPVLVPDDSIGDGVKKVQQDRRSGDIVLLENVRFHGEEEANGSKYAMALKGNAEVYVTDAFGSLHRAHASTDSLPRSMSERGAGFLVQKELTFLQPLLEGPRKPYAVILGGAKVSDKIKVIERLLRKVDALYIGGAMAFTFLRARGVSVGKSLVEEDKIMHATRLMDEARSRGVRLVLPTDVVIGKSVEEPGSPKTVGISEIPSDYMGLDVGPQTVALFADSLRTAKTIFWNGPLGLFEKPPFDAGTVAIAKTLASLSDATRVVGGGDSVSALNKAGVEEKMNHVSTGGGATLEFLEGKPLPGLESLAV